MSTLRYLLGGQVIRRATYGEWTITDTSNFAYPEVHENDATQTINV